jgi:hypothetical protein
MKTNTKAVDSRLVRASVPTRLAGGYGMRAARQNAEALLRRAVMACLLWEDIAYESGSSVAKNIAELVAEVNPQTVYEIALEAKKVQKLRHVPLFIATEMAKLDTHKYLVADLLAQIVDRPDALAETLAIYWKNGRTPVSAQIKRGLSQAFTGFSEFQFAKYKGNRNDIKLRDVLRIVHPRPLDKTQNTTFKRIATDTLPVPDTWETQLSAGADKKATWERLIRDRQLGALAYLRNLRNMNEVGVSKTLIRNGLETLNPKWLLPLHFVSAAKYAPEYEQELESLMLKMFDGQTKLPGLTVFIVDVSGSMSATIGDKSLMSRQDVANAMAMIAGHLSEKFVLYATAGSDYSRIHKTERLAPRRGFGMMDVINKAKGGLGGGGIFTRQALEYVKSDLQGETPDRILVFSDSQDCDNVNKIPSPFGKRNYIIDVSANRHGVNYETSKWTAEISGWSENFVNFILAMEGVSLQQEDDN